MRHHFDDGIGIADRRKMRFGGGDLCIELQNALAWLGAEVDFTSADCSRSQLAAVCPTAAPNETLELNEVDVSAAS